MKKNNDNGAQHPRAEQQVAGVSATHAHTNLGHQDGSGRPASYSRGGAIDRRGIPGWGTDLERPRPRNMQPDEPHPIVPLEPLPEQSVNVEILCSTERPDITPLFGTSVPPSGVSGTLRRMAYKQSENDIRRWLTLLLADRVNVIEGIGADLREGKIPNIFQEMGGRAEWEHNRAGLIRKTAVAAVFAGLVVYLVRRR